MPTTLLQVAYRPVRVCWLVRDRSRTDLRDTFRLASCLWGGMFGLIADAAGDPGRVDKAIARFRADVLHPVVETEAARSVIERNPHLAWPLVFGGVVSGDEPGEPGLVDLSRALRLRPRTNAKTAVSVAPVWEETDNFALVYAATFGDLSHPTLGSRQRATFVRATAAEEAPAAAVAASFDYHEVPLEATRSGLRWMPSRFELHDVPGVFVGSSTSLRDVRSYWNVRAVGAEVVFWDTRDPTGGPFRAVVVARIRAAAAVQKEVPENFRVFACDVATRARDSNPRLPDPLRTLIAESGLHPTITRIDGDIGITDWIRDGIRFLPSAPEDHVVAHTDHRTEDESRVTIELPRTPLADEEWARQELAIQIGTYVDSGYHGTLKLPYLPDLNPWYRWEISVACSPLRR